MNSMYKSVDVLQQLRNQLESIVCVCTKVFHHDPLDVVEVKSRSCCCNLRGGRT